MTNPTFKASNGQPDNNTCGNACAPSPGGCLRCDAVPAGNIPANTSALLFAPRDSDARAALKQVLNEAQLNPADYGPLVLVRDIRDRLGTLGSLLNLRLSLATKTCIQAAYAPGGVESVNSLLETMAFSMPLSEMLGNIEHEWIRTALQENWLYSVFHPIVQAGTGEVFANEALLRARNPRDNKVIGAGPIINACEELNLTHQLDQRARQVAIRAAAQYLPANSKVFINFLPNTIYDPEICLRTTMEAAEANNVSMDRLIFEVVETEKIPDMDHLCKVLNYYRDRGVGTAIDDMGAGFTTLDYILNLKPNFVKLDREFILAAVENAGIRRNMETIIRTSHGNNARVIAEGIETPQQMTMCVDAGIDFLQGFLFAKPACPPEAVRYRGVIRQAA